MIDPSVLIDNLVDLLRSIPDLVKEMNGERERIYAYHDEYPRHVSLAVAIHQMPTPSIMAAWQGTGPGRFGEVDVWEHHVTLYLRAGEPAEAAAPPAAYYRLFRLITKGVPADSETPMLYTTVHPSCQSMEVPSIERQADAEGLDYFEAPLIFKEIGDD